jgi:hypothetical protein
MTPVEFDPAVRVPITDPDFNANDPSTWRFAPAERRVWAVTAQDGRLFYSVASGPEIWSVGIGPDVALAADARLEIRVSAPTDDPISDITFDADGAIFLAQRGQVAADYDYTDLALPDRASLLVYTGKKQSDGSFEWTADPGEYPVVLKGITARPMAVLPGGMGTIPMGSSNTTPAKTSSGPPAKCCASAPSTVRAWATLASLPACRASTRNW